MRMSKKMSAIMTEMRRRRRKKHGRVTESY